MTTQSCDPPDYSLPEDDTSITRKHFLDRDPHDPTSCRVCGDVYGYGVLHLTERGEFDTDDIDRPPVCKACRHYAHQGRCWASVPAYPEPRACPCQGAAA